MIQEAAIPASDPLRAPDARVPEGAPDAHVAATESAPPTRTLNRRDDQFFEELTRTNNDLANLQRDLARKNAELAAAQRKLQASEQRYLGLSACSPIGILEMDLAERCLYSNPHWHSFTGLDAGASLATGWQRALDPGAAPDFLQAWRKALAEGREFGREVRLVSASGEARWAHFRSRPIRTEDGAVVGHVSTVEDITVRRRSEAALAEANKQMVEVSRLAGMAEVATSVLHNVGNVLNSVNVSMEIAAKKVRQLKAASLGKVAALVQQHAGDPAAFFANPQGAKLPAFLGELAEHFVAEQAALLDELGSLKGNIEHINEIVAMQQSYAGGGGLMETLAVADVIEDALRMNAAALERHGALVVREFDPALPAVPIDRHKLLQILVNLICNAKHAMDEPGAAGKQLTVRTERNGVAFKVSVSDMGIGIDRENLTRIFNHGFTTKKEGHGFGLHSSANAATEMGGRLSVHSDGIGHGATFTVELPLSRGEASPASLQNA